MFKTGLIEGFFGPTWSEQARLGLAPFMAKYGGSFYFYAPKRDPHLRKSWREPWSQDYLQRLKNYASEFHGWGIKFGVGFSPFGLGIQLTQADRQQLELCFKQLAICGINQLGVFFDDMPVTDGLLATQTEVLCLAQKFFSKELIFCPSFYSDDPILDKVFGQRPTGYVESLATAIPKGIDICWTGPKVISEEISLEHLTLVHQRLGRAPFIWENLYANDGPRNCKFLKLKYFTGRSEIGARDISGIGFNLMNQPHLSRLVYLSSLQVIQGNPTPAEAFEWSCHELCPPGLADLILKDRPAFLELGLDKLSENQKHQLQISYAQFAHPIAQEICDWLKGSYLVGPECLTD